MENVIGCINEVGEDNIFICVIVSGGKTGLRGYWVKAVIALAIVL